MCFNFPHSCFDNRLIHKEIIKDFVVNPKPLDVVLIIWLLQGPRQMVTTYVSQRTRTFYWSQPSSSLRDGLESHHPRVVHLASLTGSGGPANSDSLIIFKDKSLNGVVSIAKN